MRVRKQEMRLLTSSNFLSYLHPSQLSLLNSYVSEKEACKRNKQTDEFRKRSAFKGSAKHVEREKREPQKKGLQRLLKAW